MYKSTECRCGRIGLALALIILSASGMAIADEVDFTEQDLSDFSPKAEAHLVRALVEGKQEIKAAGITTSLRRLAHFLAQVATETGGLTRLDENLNYSEGGLLRTFSRTRVPEDKAKELAAISPPEVKMRTIANWIYGDILGNNGRDTDDGWDYRGSGFIQLTGRGNYKARGDELKLALVERPDLARQVPEALRATVAYWKARAVNDAADDDDIRRVRMLVNGPRAHALHTAQIWLNRARDVFLAGSGTETGAAMLEVAASDNDAVSGALEELGFLQPGARESAASGGQVLSEALSAYQKSQGLPETGEFDLDTLYSITNQPGVNGDPQELASVPQSDPETSVTFDLASDQATTASRTVNAASSPSIVGQVGTGATVADADLAPAEFREFENSTPTYAPYELEAGRRDEKGNFVEFSVIEPDEREPVEDTTTYPGRAIVQFLFSANDGPRRHLCTGALISPDTVLTAGHCVHEGRQGGAWYARFEVYPGRNGSVKPFGSCQARKVYALSGWVNAANPLDARYYDLGALKLDCDVGSRTGWLGVRAFGDAEVGLVAIVEGYPAGETFGSRQWKSAGQFQVVQSLKVFYQIDTSGGMSGSPVFAPAEKAVVAIHTNGLHGTGPWKSNNGATRITPERLTVIRSWADD